MSITRAPITACCAALRRGLLRSAPRTNLDGKGYVDTVSDNLIENVRLADFEDDLRKGDGNELKTKFRSNRSSSALAVNNFAPFRRDPGNLKLPGGANFSALQFERKCPHGLKSRRSPHLDVFAEGTNSFVAIESKCLEPLSSKEAKFAAAYEREILDDRRRSSWFQEMRQLLDEPSRYRWLDAAQLIKHAFGLSHTFKNKLGTLLYLYWEPLNPEKHPFFSEHRAELERFSNSIRKQEHPRFVSMSYPELWRSWDMLKGPDWLTTHLCRIRARYEVEV